MIGRVGVYPRPRPVVEEGLNAPDDGRPEGGAHAQVAAGIGEAARDGTQRQDLRALCAEPGRLAGGVVRYTQRPRVQRRRRNNRSPDDLTVMLVHVKGGSARVTAEEIGGLRVAARKLKITWNVAEKPGRIVRFRRSTG